MFLTFILIWEVVIFHTICRPVVIFHTICRPVAIQAVIHSGLKVETAWKWFERHVQHTFLFQLILLPAWYVLLHRDFAVINQIFCAVEFCAVDYSPTELAGLQTIAKCLKKELGGYAYCIYLCLCILDIYAAEPWYLGTSLYIRLPWLVTDCYGNM